MAFQLFYNDLFPLRMINFAKKYLDVGGSISFDNRSAIQLSKLQVIDSFFPGLFVKAINEEKEAEYDYDTCYILAPRKMGALSNWGPYKQKINGIEDCLLGNRRSETGYKNYLAARNMIRRAAVDLAADEGLFHFIFSHLTHMHECLNEEQKKSLDAWMLKTLTACGREKTVRFCTQERPDGFSFEHTIYLDILSRMNVFAKNRDFRSLFAWLCLVCLLGNSSEKLLKKYAGTKPDTLPKDEPAYELIPSPGVIGVPGFCGRDDILAEIDQLFSRGNRVVCLSGISGIGKTETAKQYAAECRAQYDCMIYAVYNGSLRDLVISEMPFETRPSVKRLNEGSSKESAESYFRRKLDIIKKASDEKTLIILDNYNTEYDEDLDVFLNGRYRVLITTQYDYSARFASIRVGPVHDEEALKTIFMNNYRGYTVQKDDPDLDELIKAANGHTYTIVLLARHMEYSGQTAREMLEALREKGIVSINEKLFETDGQPDEAYHRLVRMFPLFEFTEEEQTVLQLLSLISGAPVPAMVFRKWAELSSMKSILNLESRGWIMRQPDGIILHSVIGSVMRHVLPFKADQIQFFLDHAAEEIANENSWGWTKKQKEQYCSICRSVLTYVNEINAYTAGFIQAAAVLLGYGGYPAQALKLDEKLYQYRYETDGPDAFETARAAYRAGWTWLFNPHLPSALDNAMKWLLKADELFEKLPMDSVSKKLMYCGLLENTAKAYQEKYELSHDTDVLQTAKEYAQKAVGLGRKWKDELMAQGKTPAGSWLRLARIHMAEEEYEQADTLVQEAYEMLMAIHGQMCADVLRATSCKAEILYHLGNYRQSMEETVKNLEAYQRFYHTDNPSFFDQLVLKIKNCIKLGNSALAAETKKEAYDAARLMFTPDSFRFRQLEEIQLT